MDALRRDDLDRARAMAPADKLRAALDLSGYGVRLKREALRRARPEASEAELTEALCDWLEGG